MDLVMLVTRSSQLKQGSMACILTNPTSVDDHGDLSQQIRQSVVSVSTNQPLFKVKSSDVHAEIGALGSASRRGISTEGCSAYITMPPCRNCLGALAAAGISRIVTRVPCKDPVKRAAQSQDIELVSLGRLEERTARINSLIHGHPDGKRRKLEEETKEARTGDTAQTDSRQD